MMQKDQDVSRSASLMRTGGNTGLCWRIQWCDNMTEEFKAPDDVSYKTALLKYNLKESDWVVVKMMEAETEEERSALRTKYADIIAQRKQWREQINELEGTE